MTSKAKAAKHKLIVGLQANYDDIDRKISPVGGLSDQEDIELQQLDSLRPASANSNSSYRTANSTSSYRTANSTSSYRTANSNSSYRTRSRNASSASESEAIGGETLSETQDDTNYLSDTSRELSVVRVRSKTGSFDTNSLEKHRSVNSNNGGIATKVKTPFGAEAMKSRSMSSFGSRQTTDMTVFLASAMSNGSATTSHTSSTNVDMLSDASGDTSARSGDTDYLALDYFCVDHMKLCSTKEIEDEHRNCEDVVPALEWADKQKLERDRTTTSKLLQRFDVFAGIMIDERHDLVRELTESKEMVTDDFLDRMEDVVTHLLRKQREFSEKFEGLHTEKIRMITEQIKHCVMVQKETSTCMRELAELDTRSEDYHNVKKKIQEKCPVYEEILRRDFQASTRMDYEFVPDKEVNSILSDLTSLGDVILRMKPSKLPGFLSQTREVDFTKRAIQNIMKHDGRCNDDKSTCSFTGCQFLSDGRVLLADWNNSCIKMFDKHCVLIFRQELKTSPWDIKNINDSTAVVTVPGEQKVYILQYTKQGLEIMTSFSTDSECWGITPIDDKFAITCDPYSKSPSVKVFSNSGKLVAFFQNDEHGKILLQYPQHITANNTNKILYVSDSRQNVVLAVTMKGKVVFKYRHEKLRSPTGVATDSQGNLYVCGKESKNVHQISKDGEFVRVLFDSSDELVSPRGICFQPNGERILVTDLAQPGCEEFMVATLS